MVDRHDQMESVYKLLVSNTSGKGFVSFNSTVIEKPPAKYFGTPNDHVIPRIELVRMKGHQKLEYSKEESTTKVFDIYKKLTHLALFSFPDPEDHTRIGKLKTKVRVPPTKGRRTLKDIIVTSYSVPDHLRQYLIEDGLRSSSCKYHRLMKNIAKAKGSEEVHGSGTLY